VTGDVNGANGGANGGCALVTGASRGIGAATATMLASDGWPVGLLCRSSRAEAEAVAKSIVAGGGRATVLVGDVADPETPDAVFEAIEGELGPVRVLVNNAGITADGLAPRMADERWATVIQTNLSGAFRMTRRALGPMMRSRWGRIVCVGSIVGRRANPGQANYAAAKAGLEAMTRTVAAEVGRRGITVNTVSPGLIDTNLTADGVSAELAHAIPVRRAGTPEEVAACIRFLASEQASYVNGSTITVDGGLTA
jgi:3-oxoacyl-[acyl-carrier protein] reductase